MDSGQKFSPFRNPGIFSVFLFFFLFFLLLKVHHVLTCTPLPCITRPLLSILVTGEALEQAGDHYLLLDATGKLSCRSVTITIYTMHGFVFLIFFFLCTYSFYSENATQYVVFVKMYSAKSSAISFTCLEKATCLLCVAVGPSCTSLK